MSHIDDLYAKHKPTAERAKALAEIRCRQAGIQLAPRQAQIVQGAILNTLIDISVERAASLVESVKAEADRLDEIKELDTGELADLLIDGVWSTLDIGTEESAIVEAAIDRLKLLDS